MCSSLGACFPSGLPGPILQFASLFRIKYPIRRKWFPSREHGYHQECVKPLTSARTLRVWMKPVGRAWSSSCMWGPLQKFVLPSRGCGLLPKWEDPRGMCGAPWIARVLHQLRVDLFRSSRLTLRVRGHLQQCTDPLGSAWTPSYALRMHLNESTNFFKDTHTPAR